MWRKEIEWLRWRRQGYVAHVHSWAASQLLKLIQTSPRLNKGNHDSDGVWIADFKIIIERLCFSVFSLVLVSIEKIYQTFKTVFDNISKDLKVHKKYTAARSIFNSLLGVWKCGQRWSFAFDILPITLISPYPHLRPCFSMEFFMDLSYVCKLIVENIASI